MLPCSVISSLLISSVSNESVSAVNENQHQWHTKITKNPLAKHIQYLKLEYTCPLFFLLLYLEHLNGIKI
jgi:hypothetical protein